MKIDPSSQVTDYSAPMPAETAPGDGAAPAERPKKTVFPDITLRGDEAAKLMAQYSAGDTFTADVTFRVTEHRSRKGGAKEYMSADEANQDSIELQIESMEVEGAEPDGADEESAEDAVDKYQAGKAAPPEED